jgi:hypothetical protein
MKTTMMPQQRRRVGKQTRPRLQKTLRMVLHQHDEMEVMSVMCLDRLWGRVTQSWVGATLPVPVLVQAQVLVPSRAQSPPVRPC